MPQIHRSKTFIYISLASDVFIAACKFMAAVFTGSTAMFSEGMHSAIDSISQLLLIQGIKTSKKQPDEDHPFGYGREQYFWSFIVSLIIFVMGGCASVYKGILVLKTPSVGGDPYWSYAVLFIALISTLVSTRAVLEEFRRRRGNRPFWRSLPETRDPSIIIVLLIDIGDILGIFIAAFGILLGHVLHNPYCDGIASIIIGLVLVILSGFLARQSKRLLMGQPARKDTLVRLKEIMESDSAIFEIKKQHTVYMAPDDVLLQADVVFQAGLSTRQITDAIQRIRKAVQGEYPMIKKVYLEPEAGS